MERKTVAKEDQRISKEPRPEGEDVQPCEGLVVLTDMMLWTGLALYCNCNALVEVPAILKQEQARLSLEASRTSAIHLCTRRKSQKNPACPKTWRCLIYICFIIKATLS